jgi:hypothetical protein
VQHERLTIADPEVARVLTENGSARLLEPFMKGILSLNEAAQELGVKLPKLLYHVKRFLDLGLLEVACVERRNGRPIKRYQSTAKAFFVPFITPSETLERLLSELTAYDTRRFHREAAQTLQNISPTWGLHVALHGDDGVSYALTPDQEGYPKPLLDVLFGPDAPAILSTEGTLKLDFQTAKALQKELDELYKRYREQRSDKGKPYAYRLGLTPLHDESFSP